MNTRQEPAHTPRPERSSRRTWLAGAVVAVASFVTAVVLIMINTTPSTDPAGLHGSDRATATTVASLEAQGSPPAVVATFDKGRITTTRAVGDSSFGADTPFYLGSLSKSLTATTAARLVDRGRLRLDAPVTTYLPWFRTRSGDSDRITIRHLLNQTSGLSTGAGMVDLTEPNTTLRQRVRALRHVDLESEPGQEFQYSNKNYATLALIIEEVAGRPYADVLRREVIEPLGMTSTETDPKAVRTRDVSQGNLPLFGAHVPMSMPPFPGALGDGYVISTARDVARFADALATGRHNGTPYLSGRLLTQQHTAPRGVDKDPDYDATYGFGVRLKTFGDRRAVWHEGELGGVHTDFGVLPRSRTGLVMLTSHNGQLFDSDAPFFAGMDALAGAPGADGPSGGGYRAVALTTSGLASMLLGWIVVDVSRWPRLGRRSRSRRLLRSVIPRLVLAAATWVAVFYGLGSAFGVEGALPVALVWQGAADLTAVVLALIGYLALSAGVVLAWTPRTHAPEPTSTAEAAVPSSEASALV